MKSKEVHLKLKVIQRNKRDDWTFMKRVRTHKHTHTQARTSGARALVPAVSGVTQKAEREEKRDAVVK